MTETPEQSIRAELALSWLPRSRRKWLENELAKITAAGSPRVEIRPDSVGPQKPIEAPRSTEGQIVIDGSPEFIAATEAALRKLQGTPSWVLASKLRGIKQVDDSHIGNSEVGGYLSDGIFHVGQSFWRAGPVQYASGIAHEGAHAARPDVSGTEGERMAFKAQAQALREMGAPSGLVNRYEREAANPTHHLNWNGPRRAA